MGGRHHPAAHRPGLAVPSGGLGRLLAAGRGLVDADHLRTELVLDALDLAIAQRHPTAGLVHHSEHGCQYTSFAFGRRLAASGLVASMGTVGDALDNAVAESFFATLECELLDRYPWPTPAGLRTAIFDFIEVFYNRQRRHSTLDYAIPVIYDQQHASAAPAA